MKIFKILCISAFCFFSSVQAQDRGFFELNKKEVIDCLFELLQGAEQQIYHEGPLTQLDHVLECAYLATEMSDDEEFIIASLLHNIGFLCGDFEAEMPGSTERMMDKEIGATFLSDCGLSARICELTKGSLQGKRYLAYKDPFFIKNLSSYDLEILEKQGGPMTEEEAQYFERDPYFEEKLLLHECDQGSHQIDIIVPNLESYKSLLEKHIHLE